MEIELPETTDTLDIPGSNRKIEIAWDADSLRPSAELKEQVFDFLRKAYSYLLDVLGENSFVVMKNILRLSHAKSHGAAGLEIRVNVDELNDERPDIQQSLFLHEIIHHLFPQEDLSMFIEMIYMLDKGQGWRFTDMRRILDQKRYSAPYLKGFRQISEWLGFDDVEKMLAAFPSMDVNELKRIFKEKYEENCENDDELVVELASYKARLAKTNCKSVPGNIS